LRSLAGIGRATVAEIKALYHLKATALQGHFRATSIGVVLPQRLQRPKMAGPFCNNRAWLHIYSQMLPVDDPPSAVPDHYRHRFERCFRDHYAQVFAFAIRRVSGREIAEDVVADTFAVVWRRRDRIPDRALPWLYAIAGNVIANQFRSTRRRHKLDMRLAQETGAVAPGSDPAESLDRRDAFSTAFALLGEPEREVLRLIAWDGLDTRDAARVFGCSPGAFRVRLHRARRKLAKQLEAAGHIPQEDRTTVSNPAEEIQ
jgi:RNA polymerase sigma-70 factor, ECF subfamily